MAQSIEERKAYQREYRRKEREKAKRERSFWRGQQDAAYEPTAEEIREYCERFKAEKLASMPDRPETEPYVMHVYSLDVIRAAMEG